MKPSPLSPTLSSRQQPPSDSAPASPHPISHPALVGRLCRLRSARLRGSLVAHRHPTVKPTAAAPAAELQHSRSSYLSPASYSGASSRCTSTAEPQHSHSSYSPASYSGASSSCTSAAELQHSRSSYGTAPHSGVSSSCTTTAELQHSRSSYSPASYSGASSSCTGLQQSCSTTAEVTCRPTPWSSLQLPAGRFHQAAVAQQLHRSFPRRNFNQAAATAATQQP
jgi:hypothetical protein